MTSVSSIIARALRFVPAPPSTNARVHLALSGGVDSSVAGFLLKERGWRITPIFMRCWTGDDNTGECVERELRAAEAATKALALEEALQDWDFVSDYWTEVFEPVLLRGLAAGLTPNPDVACNATVKFRALPARIRAAGGRHYATGHYARLDANGALRCATDTAKDQTYFLAHCAQEELRDAIFPVGALLKSETRAIARHLALPSADAASTKGLCFVGARRLSELVEQYLPVSASVSASTETGEGRWFVDAECGRMVARMPRPQWAYTVGQRARIGGAPEAWYVAGKRASGDVVVTRGADSPRLFTRTLLCGKPHWIGAAPHDDKPLHAKLKSCGAMQPCRIEETRARDGVVVRFENAVRRTGAGQLIALYSDLQCLGGCLVTKTNLQDGGGLRDIVDEGEREGVFA